MVITVERASDKMTAENQARMVALKAEYSKLSTSAKRMVEIMSEMKKLVAAIQSDRDFAQAFKPNKYGEYA